MADADRLSRDGEALLSRRAVLALAVLALAFGVVIVGGYRLGWSWTGFSDNGTIWDWLQLLVLPSVLTLLPLWYRTRRSLRIEWQGAAVALAVASAVLIVGGYTYDWHFTGFPGKTLWDWLDLLVLPFALSLLPISPERSRGGGSGAPTPALPGPGRGRARAAGGAGGVRGAGGGRGGEPVSGCGSPSPAPCVPPSPLAGGAVRPRGPRGTRRRPSHPPQNPSTPQFPGHGANPAAPRGRGNPP